MRRVGDLLALMMVAAMETRSGRRLNAFGNRFEMALGAGRGTLGETLAGLKLEALENM